MEQMVDMISTPEARAAYLSVESARRFDREARVMSRRYGQAHRIQNELIAATVRRLAPQPATLLDLGCGTANDGMDLLKRSTHLRYLGVDRSTPMTDIGAAKLTRCGFRGRFEFMNADLLKLASRPATLAAECRSRNVAAVLISLVLHHYDPACKERIYRMIRAVLEPGSRLIVTDLFTSPLQDCATHALDLELKGVKSALQRLHAAGSARVSQSSVSEDHYRRENRPSTLAREMECLRRSGFQPCDVVYRHGQLAVIAAGG